MFRPDPGNLVRTDKKDDPNEAPKQMHLTRFEMSEKVSSKETNQTDLHSRLDPFVAKSGDFSSKKQINKL
jgi:hypothetical protein